MKIVVVIAVRVEVEGECIYFNVTNMFSLFMKLRLDNTGTNNYLCFKCNGERKIGKEPSINYQQKHFTELKITTSDA